MKPKTILFFYALLITALFFLQLKVFGSIAPGPDTLCYLQMADQFSQVGYLRALSGHWSPLYPLYLWAVNSLFSVSVSQEINASIIGYAGVLMTGSLVGAFFLLFLARRLWPQDSGQPLRLAWIVSGLGFLTYLLWGVHKIHLRLPDGLVFIFATLTLGSWCFAFSEKRKRWFFLAGFFSSLGFLARSSFFPWSLAVLILGLLLSWDLSLKKRATFGAVFMMGFVLLAGPQVYSLSKVKGFFTFGGGKVPLAEIYEVAWDQGGPVWPVRYAGGDVRIYEDRRLLNFPGFYEPEREIERARIIYSFKNTVRGILRGVQTLFFGFWSPSFALLWPLIWACWPLALFGVEHPWRHFKRVRHDSQGAFKLKTALFLISAGSLGFGMHLFSACLGYYLPPYLFPIFLGLNILILEKGVNGARRAMAVVAVGFVLVTVLTTLSFFRHAHRASFEKGKADTEAMVTSIERLPKPSQGLRKLAAGGYWLGLYAVRLTNSQIYADLPNREVFLDAVRFEAAKKVMVEKGIVGILVPLEWCAQSQFINFEKIENSSLCLISLASERA